MQGSHKAQKGVGVWVYSCLLLLFTAKITEEEKKKKLHNVCQKNNMWEYQQGFLFREFNMLFRVWVNSKAQRRKTHLSAVLTEIDEWGRLYQV